jgi:excisionase family DNA binding protein
VTPDDLLAGVLEAVSRFGIVWIGETAIDLQALGVPAAASPGEPGAKAAYSTATAAVFDRAAALARSDVSDRVEAVHLLAAYAHETSGLMGELKRRYGFDDSAWRAGLARWPRHSGNGSAASVGAPAPETRKEFLRPEEAAEFLGLHIQTVRGYIRSGKLPALRIAGERAIRIRRDDLVALLEPLEPGGGEDNG